MSAPNRSNEVASWITSHRHLFVSQPGVGADDIRREILIPLAQHLNTLEGRNVWGRLIKRERVPPFIPHDIVVWKDTRQHFDVFTGTEHVEDTQPAWGVNGPPDNPAWEWLDVGQTPNPQPVPVPVPTPTPPSPVPPVPVPPPTDLDLVLQLLNAIDDKLAIIALDLQAVQARQDRPLSGKIPYLGTVTLKPQG